MRKKKENVKENKTILTVVKDGIEEKKELNKPTPEEVIQFKKDFDKAMEDFREKKWEISEKGVFGANDVAMFLFDYIKRFGAWTKTGWMGILKMDEELKKALALVNEETGLSLDYQALEFCAYMLTNPGGIGIDSALEFEKIADKYAKIATVVGSKVEEARNELKHVQYLQEKWGAGEQGFALSELEPILNPEEEKKETEEEKNPNDLGTLEVDLSKEE
jgi:hypothetical protein